MTKASFKMRLSPVVAISAMFATAAAMLVALFMFVPGLAARADVGDNGTGANTANIEIKYVMASAAKISFGVLKPQNLTYTFSDGSITDTNTITNSVSAIPQVVTSSTTWASGATVMLTISASGTGTASLEGFGSGATADSAASSNQSMRRLISFGNFGISKLDAAFAKTPADFTIYPQLPSSVTNLHWLFASSNANPDISNWDVSHVTNLFGAFSAAAFNRNLNSWDVSAVTDFTQTFNGALAKFNNGNAIGVGGTMTWLSTGSSAASINLTQMFAGNGAFNQNVSSWNVAKSTSFAYTFSQASKFNNGEAAGGVGTSPLTWNTANATSFDSMFSNALVFNQSISGFDTSKATTTANMFYLASAFNNGLASGASGTLSLNTSLVTSMTGMFRNAAAFNQNINGWNVSKVTNMQYVFGNASSFNQPLNDWNVTSVSNMGWMFLKATSFNQPLDKWNTASVQYMTNMFDGASVFNQSLASFNISRVLVTGLVEIFGSGSISTSGMTGTNIDRTLVSWSYQNVGYGSIGAYGKPKWSTCAGYYAVQRMSSVTFTTGWITPSTVPTGCSAQHVTWTSSTVYFNNKTLSQAAPSPAATTDSASAVRYVIAGLSGSASNSLCNVNYETGVFSYLVANYAGTCTVRAFDPSDTGDGASSNYVDVNYVLQRPEYAPGALGATVISDTQINLTWTEPGLLTGSYTDYRIEYSSDNATTWSVFAHTASTATSASITGLVGNTSYRFRVALVNALGINEYSSASTAKLTKISAPTSVIANSFENGTVTVSWVGATQGTATTITYRVQARLAGVDKGTLCASTTSPCVITGLTNGTTYDIVVTPYDASTSVSGVIFTPYPTATPSAGVTSLSTGSPTATTVPLSWVQPVNGSSVTLAGITGYTVQYSTGDYSTWSDASSSVATGTGYTVTGLTGNTNYKFRVRLNNPAGTAPWVTTSTGVLTSPVAPSAPTNVAGTSDVNGSSVITWTPGSNGGSAITGYKVEYSTDGTAWSTATASTAASPYTITGLTNGTSYYVRVSGINSIGTGSAGVSVATFLPGTVPSAPTSVSGTSGVNVSSVISWTPGADGGRPITGYKVEYSTDGTLWTIATASTSSSPYTITGLTNGTSYYVRVNAINSLGIGAAGTSVATFSPGTVPSAPTNVSGTSAANGSSVITWTPGSDGGSAITGYKVEYSTDGSAWTTAVASTSSSPYTITGLTNGTSYYVRVSGINSIGTGAAGVSVATFLPGAVPGAPTSVTATSSELGQSTVSWSAPASNGGRAITSFSVTSSPGGFTCTAVAPATSCVVTGLTYATNYTFSVTATNILGTSSSSAASATITVGGLAGAPTVYNSLRNGTKFESVVIPPASNGGSTITGYQYRYKLTIGGSWTSWANAPTPTSTTVSGQPGLYFVIPGIAPTVQGQENWGALQFRAITSAGAGATSVQAPNVVDINITGADNGQFTFDFDLSDDGNSQITDYQYQLMAGNTQVWSQWMSMGVNSDAQPFTITGLTNGIGYNLRVRAENAVGYSSGGQSTSLSIPTGYPNKPLPTLTFTYPSSTTVFQANATFTPTFTNSGNGSATFASLAVSVCSADPATGVVTVLSAGTCTVRMTVAEGTLHRSSLIQTAIEVTAAAQSPINWNVSSTSAPYMDSILLAVTGGDGTGQVTYAKSGTSTCSIIGAIVILSDVGSVCSVTATKAASGGFAAVSTTTALLLTSTPIPQADVVPTFGLTAFVNQSVSLQATGGSGTGAYQYTVTNAGTTGCSVNPTTKVVTFTGAGSCVISTERAASTNYNASVATSKTIVVSRRTQSMTFTSVLPTLPLAGDTYQAAATSSSTLPVTFTVSSGNCAVVNGEITFTGVGACAIAATQAGDNVFLPASATQTVVVGQRNQVLSFDAATNAISTKTFGGVGFLVRANTSESTATLVYSVSADTTNGACTVTTSGFVTIQAVGTCVIQVDSAGASTFAAASSISKTIGIVADLPGAPAIGSVSAGNMKATLGFFAPSYTGGSAITGYRVIAVDQAPGSTTEISDSSCGIVPLNSTITCVVSGLTNGSTYKFKVAAINEAGTGAFSALSAAVTVATNPSAVQNLSVAEGNAALIISWSAPDSLGGGTFSAYRIFIKKSSEATYDQDHFFNVVNYNTSSVTVSLESPGDGMTFLGGPALRNGVAYDVKIVTVTTANLLELEANTALVNQIPHTVPDAPLVASSVVVGSQLVLTWTAPLSDGGKPILGYSVTFQNSACTLANPSDTLCAVVLPTAPGTYTFQVVATNEAGQSAPRTGTFYVASVPVRQPVSSGGAVSNGGSEPVTNQPPVTKPFAPIVKSVSVATDGKSITVLGSDLSEILTISVGSIAAKIISQDGGTMVISATGIPAGVYDLMIAFKDGTKLREVGAITIAGAKPVTPAKFKARTVSGFAKGSALLSATQTRELKTYFKSIRGTSTIECIGSTEGPSILKADAKLAMMRSAYVCSLAKASGVKIKSTSYVNQVRVGAKYRSVSLKVWKLPTK